MRYTPQTQSFKVGSRSVRLQSLLYAALLLACIGLVAPWPNFSIGLVAAGILTITLTTVAVWLVIRQNRLQTRVRHLELQLRQLHHQKPPQPLEAQSLLHVEPENFFNKEQTRH